MGLNIDTSRILRGSHRLDELVQAIYTADSSTTSETHWVEWKRSLDSGAADHCTSIATGMSNWFAMGV